MTEVEIVYWKDSINGEIASKKISIEPYGYQLSDFAEWKMLIAAKDVSIKENKIAVVDIEELKIPKNTIVSPLSIMRHALGSVVDVFQPGEPKKVEDEKIIKSVLFLPIKDGIIKRGQLVGVINVRYVRIGKIKKISELIKKWLDEASWGVDKGGIVFESL